MRCHIFEDSVGSKHARLFASLPEENVEFMCQLRFANHEIMIIYGKGEGIRCIRTT